MLLLRSILFNLYLAVLTLLLGILLWPMTLFGPKAACLAAKLWAYMVKWGLRLLCNIRMEVRGKKYLPPGAFILACKHQSAWETILLFTVIDVPVFILKKQLLIIPVVGGYIRRMKSIIIDRADGPKAIKKMLESGRARISDGRPIVIFPEGTRSMPGVEARYHSGVAALYTHLEVPLVPAALNSGQCWGRNAFIKKPGTIILEFLKPISADELRRDQVVPVLKDIIEPASKKLLKVNK